MTESANESANRSATIDQKMTRNHTNQWGLSLLHGFLMIAVPVLLTLLSVRAVMTPLFLNLEYHRPGFPEDVYGFTLEDRLYYAPFALEYLLNGEGIDYLGDLTFSSGQPLYTERELGHMVDVKVVTQAAYAILAAGLIAFALICVYLWRTSRQTLARGLMSGAVLTLSIIAAIVIAAVIAWDTFFTAFHEIFFESGTWIFLYSDTLIRLFPEQFWFDAALTIGGLTTLGALLILFISFRLRRSRV